MRSNPPSRELLATEITSGQLYEGVLCVIGVEFVENLIDMNS